MMFLILIFYWSYLVLLCCFKYFFQACKFMAVFYDEVLNVYFCIREYVMMTLATLG